jgi:hypothetical protein
MWLSRLTRTQGQFSRAATCSIWVGAVIAGHHDAAVLGKTGEDRKRRGAVEAVIRVDFRYMRVHFGIGRNFEIAVDTEHLPDRHLHVGQSRDFLVLGRGGGRHKSSEASDAFPKPDWLNGCGLGAVFSLSECAGWQKPAAQSKFRSFFIEIGADRGFWKAALRITPHFCRKAAAGLF